MEPIEYTHMREQEDRHWWFQSRLMFIENLYRLRVLNHFRRRQPRLLDLGCGTGMFLKRRTADSDGHGADFSHAALAYSRERGLTRLTQADATRLPYADASFDVVTAFDLIEHVPDDAALVAEVWRVLKPRGFFLATVPAHPIMWSGHDISLHHMRRYKRGQFEALFAPKLWERLRMSFAFFLIFPVAVVVRMFRRLFKPGSGAADTAPVPGWLNWLLIQLHRPEAALLTRTNLPIGVSLITLRRKR
jgi:SAM-dependent methyltransferase